MKEQNMVMVIVEERTILWNTSECASGILQGMYERVYEDQLYKYEEIVLFCYDEHGCVKRVGTLIRKWKK